MKKTTLFILVAAFLAFSAGPGSKAMAAEPGSAGGLEDSRMDRGNADWHKDKPVDKDKGDKGYNVEGNKGNGGLKEEGMDRGNADWHKDKPVDKDKGNTGYNVEGNKGNGGLKEESMDRGNADWNKDKEKEGAAKP